MSDQCTIYFVQEGHDGPIKIGATKQSLYHRIAHMQCGNYRRLQVLGVIVDQKRKAEIDWHRRFANVRIHGEWFVPTAKLLQAILDEAEEPSAGHAPSTSLIKQARRGLLTRAGWVHPEARNLLKAGAA